MKIPKIPLFLSFALLAGCMGPNQQEETPSAKEQALDGANTTVGCTKLELIFENGEPKIRDTDTCGHKDQSEDQETPGEPRL